MNIQCTISNTLKEGCLERKWIGEEHIQRLHLDQSPCRSIYWSRFHLGPAILFNLYIPTPTWSSSILSGRWHFGYFRCLFSWRQVSPFQDPRKERSNMVVFQLHSVLTISYIQVTHALESPACVFLSKELGEFGDPFKSPSCRVNGAGNASNPWRTHSISLYSLIPRFYRSQSISFMPYLDENRNRVYWCDGVSKRCVSRNRWQ